MTQIGFVVDGVARRMNDQANSNPNGLALLNALIPTGRVTLLADGYDRDRKVLEHFLKFHRITGYADIDISVLSDGASSVDRRMAQLNRLRRTGPVSFMVEPDPKIAAALMAEGVPTLLYLHPQYTVPSWRPDYGGSLRRWDDMVAETERQVSLRAEEDLMDKETL